MSKDYFIRLRFLSRRYPLGVALELNTGVPSYHVDDEEGRTHLLIHLPISADEHRWCIWRPDHAGFDSRSIFERALVEE